MVLATFAGFHRNFLVVSPLLYICRSEIWVILCDNGVSLFYCVISIYSRQLKYISRGSAVEIEWEHVDPDLHAKNRNVSWDQDSIFKKWRLSAKFYDMI